MKKFLVILFFIMAAVSPLKLFAVSANIGANMWYAWFEPGFKDELMGKKDSTSYNNNFNMTEPAAPVYGALLGLKFSDRVSIGGVFSYGTGWKCEADYMFKISTFNRHTSKEVNEIHRFEGDLTINYAISNIFKVFFGWKYFMESGKGNYTITYLSSPVGSGDFDSTITSTGPGLGVSSTFQLTNNIYFIPTLSGIYQKGETKQKVAGFLVYETTSSSEYLGGNASANLAYVIPDSSVTMSLGGRYQYLKKIGDSDKTIFYGVMLSAIYSVNLAGN